MLAPDRPFVLETATAPSLALGPRLDPIGDEFWAQLAVLTSAVAWSAGSIYAKRQRPRTPPLMSAAMQSLVAGVFLCGIGLALGETARWHWTPAGLWSLVYLTLFGSCLAYAAYIFLLHNVSPAMLGTYAYVNPAVAVGLGWLVLAETLTSTEILGMVVILAGVVLVTLGQSRARHKKTAR
jgi:drug/metabolite transporter (DMT)-like permease